MNVVCECELPVRYVDDLCPMHRRIWDDYAWETSLEDVMSVIKWRKQQK